MSNGPPWKLAVIGGVAVIAGIALFRHVPVRFIAAVS
jgi:hypothetical protein